MRGMHRCADLIAMQVWFESKDGTQVPMFIVRHKDTKFDGTAPAFQYGKPSLIFCTPAPPLRNALQRLRWIRNRCIAFLEFVHHDLYAEVRCSARGTQHPWW